MSYQKQPDLNKSYYGPPIPPPPKSYNHPKRHRPRCSCCLLNCLCDCLLGCLYNILCTILITLTLTSLLLWLIIRPHGLKLHASDASLTTFNFTNSDNLNYNLAVNFTVRNPNKNVGVYYDSIEAKAVYSGQRLRTVQGPVFYQGHENSTDFGPLVWKGQQVVVLGSGEKVEFEKESDNGVFGVQLKMDFRVRVRVFGLFKSGKWKVKVKCDLKVPLKGKSSGEKFERTRCHYDL